MAKKRKKQKRGKKKVKKSGPRIPTPENITIHDVGDECAIIQDYISDIENHDVTENLNSESMYEIYKILGKINTTLDSICHELEHAQEEPKYSFSRSQIKELEKL